MSGIFKSQLDRIYEKEMRDRETESMKKEVS